MRRDTIKICISAQRSVNMMVSSGGERVTDPGGLLGHIFAGYVPLASQNPYPIIVIFYGQL